MCIYNVMAIPPSGVSDLRIAPDLTIQNTITSDVFCSDTTDWPLLVVKRECYEPQDAECRAGRGRAIERYRHIMSLVPR